MLSKDKTASLLAEFFGTFVLTAAVLGTVAKGSGTFVTAITAGAALGLVVLVLASVSGANINPAVTFGLWSVRKTSTTQAIVYIASQLLGGVCALRMAEYFLDLQLRNMAGKNFDWRILIAEAVGTFVFTFGIASALNNKLEGGRLAAAIGMSLFVGITIASMASNGILNPAVAFGLHSYSVNYVVGPLVGAVLGMNVYQFIFEAAPAKKRSKSKKK